MSSPQTQFGSLDNYQKGGVEVINDDAKHYVFSNVFEVASKFKPYDDWGLNKTGIIGIQGDHTGTLELRNLKIRVIK